MLWPLWEMVSLQLCQLFRKNIQFVPGVWRPTPLVLSGLFGHFRNSRSQRSLISSLSRENNALRIEVVQLRSLEHLVQALSSKVDTLTKSLEFLTSHNISPPPPQTVNTRGIESHQNPFQSLSIEYHQNPFQSVSDPSESSGNIDTMTTTNITLTTDQIPTSILAPLPLSDPLLFPNNLSVTHTCTHILLNPNLPPQHRSLRA